MILIYLYVVFLLLILSFPFQVCGAFELFEDSFLFNLVIGILCLPLLLIGLLIIIKRRSLNEKE